MPSGSSKDIVFQFHALVTIDEHGRPYGEATTDADGVAPDGHLSRAWNCVSNNGYGIAPISFEVHVQESDLQVDGPIAVVAQISNGKALESGMIIDAKVDTEEERFSWDDEENWAPEGDSIPSPRTADPKLAEKNEEAAMEMEDDPIFDDFDFEEAFTEEPSDSPFDRFMPTDSDKPAKVPKKLEDVEKSLHSANFSEDNDLVISVMEPSQED